MKTLVKLILQRILGFKYYLYLFSIFIIRKLPWDKHEKDFIYFLKLIPNNGLVLDIGANIGVMSYYLSKKIKYGNVISFEPIPYNFNNLKRLIKKYNLDNIEPYQLALGNSNGEIEMIMPIHHSVKFHGLAHVKSKKHSDIEEGETIVVNMKKLDDVLKSRTQPITGIKIDVENYEFNVLSGAKEILQKNKPIIYCELWDNENRKNTIQLLRSLGYITKVLIRNKLVEFVPEIHQTQNFFFLPEKTTSEN